MPEASVDKNCQTTLAKTEVWPSEKVGVTSPTKDSAGTQKFNELALSGSVPGRENPRHYLRPLLVTNLIHWVLSKPHIDQLRLPLDTYLSGWRLVEKRLPKVGFGRGGADFYDIDETAFTFGFGNRSRVE